MTSPIFLDHRAVLMVSGDDAETFLQGLLTQSTLGLAEGETRYGGLLTAQGKIIADMLATRIPQGFLVDCDVGISAALLKRLTLFRLRAKVAVEMRPDLAVVVFSGENDPRADDAPRRRIAARERSGDDPAAYHTARIAAGLAEQGIDFAAEEVFPADVNMDLLNGVDFKKGCFVGQEVVSRMKRRGTARRRTLAVELAAGVAAPCPVLAGESEIGTMTSSAGGLGLARVRIDRMAEAEARGVTLTAAGQPVNLRRPAWLADELAALNEAKESRA